MPSAKKSVPCNRLSKSRLSAQSRKFVSSAVLRKRSREDVWFIREGAAGSTADRDLEVTVHHLKQWNKMTTSLICVLMCLGKVGWRIFRLTQEKHFIMTASRSHNQGSACLVFTISCVAQGQGIKQARLFSHLKKITTKNRRAMSMCVFFEICFIECPLHPWLYLRLHLLQDVIFFMQRQGH